MTTQRDDLIRFRYPTSIHWGPNYQNGFHVFSAVSIAEAIAYCNTRWPDDDNRHYLQVFVSDKWQFLSVIGSDL